MWVEFDYALDNDETRDSSLELKIPTLPWAVDWD